MTGARIAHSAAAAMEALPPAGFAANPRQHGK